FLEKWLFDALCYQILVLQICHSALYDSVVELPGFDIAWFLESSGRPRVPGWQRWILYKGSSGGMLTSSGHELPRQRASLRQVLHLLRVRVQGMTKGPPHRCQFSEDRPDNDDFLSV
ncbi:hypothetical protein HPB47_003322, partial [Ixodes persulcatus]